MNREIKFRAWDKRFDQWSNLHINTGGILGPELNDLIAETQENCILMQFTGLKDKNGVEIYEGDILDFDPDEFGGEVKEVITMEKLIWGDYCGGLSDIAVYREVIGNIYENPELLND